MKQERLLIRKARVHNLKDVDISLDPNQLVVFTGVSGSGKSSLAFDTIYTEGQRRYVESLSTFARRYLGDLAKPDAEHISGISPTISIEQKTAGRNPRSTVGTMTEIYDYMRVLWARVAVPHCPISGEPVSAQSRESILNTVRELEDGTRLILLAPIARGKKGEFKDEFREFLRKGFMRVRVDGTIYSLEDDIALDGTVAHDVEIVVDRLVVDHSSPGRLTDSVMTALELGQGALRILLVDEDVERFFSMHAFSEASGLSYDKLEPQDFSFNSPAGMCERCEGLGVVREFELEQIVDPEKSIAEDCCSIASSYDTVRYGNIYRNLARLYKFSVDTPWKDLKKSAQKIFLHGTQKKWVRMHFVHPDKGSTWTDYVAWRGVLHEAHKRYADAKSDGYRRRMDKLMTQQCCPACEGQRIKAYPAAALLGTRPIAFVNGLTVHEALDFFNTLKLSADQHLIAEELLKEITERLQFLAEVGLDYLTLNRTAPTLSGGEAQRVRLASQIGCGLVGVTYVLDEPSIGLHPRDNRRLLSTLKRLRDKGNTVIVVEHDEETMWEADRVYDFGPGAGSKGGRIVAEGTLPQVLRSKESVTAAYLRGDRSIAVPEKRREAKQGQLKLKGVKHHNLKNVQVTIPLGIFVAVTGVSGSGKSSLISDVLHPLLSNTLHNAELPVGEHSAFEGIKELDKVIAIDQLPIGRNPRSNPATYIKVFDEIRDLFAQLPESRARGYGPGRFSFNVKEGSCVQCHGMGQIKVDMDFMDDAWVDCPLCKTRRYDAETLSIRFKGKSIFDILDMEIEAAAVFFEAIPSLHRKLKTLLDVGLGYMKLGQASTTLSGGEAQRIKLARELVRPSNGRTLYILDEPTTGLHFEDIHHLLKVLHALVERGNSVLVIEHNMDVVKTADWIIDMGPEGGAFGGKVVATGTPESIARKKTPSGMAIRQALEHDPASKTASYLEEAKASPRKRARKSTRIDQVRVKGASLHNLKDVNAEIPHGKVTVCTGPSGSGKTSLALDTIYAEGQRRYTESLSPYARQFVRQMPKPKASQIEGLSPAIAIEQKAHAGNPRSTVGTQTEIYDYLRVLYARCGIPHCPETGEVIQAISKEHVVDRIVRFDEGEILHILAPIELSKSESFKDVLARYTRLGYLRLRLNGEYYELDEEIPFDRRRKNALELVVDRLKVTPSSQNRIFEAVENASRLAQGKLIVVRGKEDIAFNLAFSVESTGKSYPEITPKTFAFNTPEGMCYDCQGLGYSYGANFDRHPEVMDMRVQNLLLYVWGEHFNYFAQKLLEQFLRSEGICPNDRLRDLKPKQYQRLMTGSGETLYEIDDGVRFRWQGINQVLIKAAKHAQKSLRSAIIPALDEVVCASCEGSRLNPLGRHVTLKGHALHSACSWPVERLLHFILDLSLPEAERLLLDESLKQLEARLRFLCDVGLAYLSLDRKAPSLSGGEAQRIKLARQLGSSLTGVLYVLDEPTIGLHPHDNHRLNQALLKLKNLGNTLLMVEHDPLTIEMADYVLDFGPQSGALGGEITARGTYKSLLKNKHSLTGAYLSGRKKVMDEPIQRPLGKKSLRVKGAQVNNLKAVDVNFPLGNLTCVTGVSGSGKSTLIHQVLAPALQRGIGFKAQIDYEGARVTGMDAFRQLITIDQKPIGHTQRSDVGTYCDLLPRMREFFTQLPGAAALGLQGKHFSPNHRAGMCTGCWGLGFKRVEMHFLPPVRITCPDCRGMRLNPRSLGVEYKGKHFGNYLKTTIDEAREVFEHIPRIRAVIDTLISVGLGYLHIGQGMASLSGGEAQRIKLSRELVKRQSGQTIYLMDEPTTGLHPDDIAKLLKVLQKLVDKGNTMIVIEHNLDFIAQADYLVDLGPGPGAAGGEIIATGRPEEVARHDGSYTGQFLRQTLAAL